jgi:hypothetical protein
MFLNLDNLEYINDYLKMLSFNYEQIRNIKNEVPDDINLFKFVKKEENIVKSENEENRQEDFQKLPFREPEKKLIENKSQVNSQLVSNQIFGKTNTDSHSTTITSLDGQRNQDLSIKHENKNPQIFKNETKPSQHTDLQTNLHVNSLFSFNKNKYPNEKEPKNNLANQIIFDNKLLSKEELKSFQQVQPILKSSDSLIKDSSIKISSSVQATNNVISQEKTSSKFRDKLLHAANLYWDKRDYRIKQSNDPVNKNQKNKIMTEYVNPTIDQLATAQDLADKVKIITQLLKELYENKKYDLYDFTLNYICQKIINKSENYLKDRKQLLLFSQFIYEIQKKFRLIEDYYLMILAYKCPYVIPKIFSKIDYADKDTLMKRLGYSNPEETLSTWITNMECYSYLFFGYMTLHSRHIEVISDYIICLEKLPVDYPLSTAFKVFLNTCAQIYKNRVEGGSSILKKLVGNYVKHLEEMSKKTKSSDLKSIAADNIHFIKKYFTQSDFK